MSVSMPLCDISTLSPQSSSPAPSKYIDYGDVGECSHHTHPQPSLTLTPHHSPTSHHSRYGCTGHIRSMAGRYQYPHLSSWSVEALLLHLASLTHSPQVSAVPTSSSYQRIFTVYSLAYLSKACQATSTATHHVSLPLSLSRQAGLSLLSANPSCLPL